MRKKDFGDGWIFYTEGSEKKVITLPHDAQLLDGRRSDSEGGSGHGYFVGNIYNYEKEFLVPLEWENKHVEILFEGIYKNATVYINGVEAASHKYGYTQFTVSLDGKLKYGEENLISVVADNSKLPNSRWYTGGGIYRPVSLLMGEKNYIPFQGVRITTLGISPARILVETETAEAEPNIEILYKGNVVATGRGKKAEIEITDAKLWSCDEPNLYEAHITVTGENGTDEVLENFGVRKLEYSTRGLFINGTDTLLRGGCVHHDNGVIGAASFRESEFRRIQIMKEQGFNAVRVSHNPASTAMLEACDYYGMYVMDETFDMWYVQKTKYDYGMDFHECWKSDVRAMIERDYNHPSVIMYSIGNEVSEPGKPDGVDKGKEIISFIKGIDDTRAVTGGMNLMIMGNYAKGKGQYGDVDKEQKPQSQKSEAKNGSLLFNTMASLIGPGMNKAGNSDRVDKITSPILDALDIAGYNYANGRYPMEGQKHPDRIVVGSETFPYEIGKNWDMVKKYPYLIGDFMWTAWDYLGEAGLGAWSYVGGMPFNRPYPWILGGAGVIDILGNPDASCGLAKVVWDITDKPVIGVRPVNHPGVRVSKSVWRGTNAIESWSWKNCDGNRAEIDVFAKADFVELFINGRSVGRKKIKEYKAFFRTKYEYGTIKVVAYDASGKEISSSYLTSAKDAKLRIEPEKKSYKSGEIAYVNVLVSDENGIIESNDDKKIHFSVEGGELLGFGSANPCTKEDYTSGVYTSYQGRAQAVIRCFDRNKLLLKAESEDQIIQKEVEIRH